MKRRIAAVALAVTMALSGCAGSSGYPAAVADDLQATVLQVTTHASGGEVDAALTSLIDLERRLEDAHAKGQISDDRYGEIKAAIARVRTELHEQRTVVGATTPTPVPTTGGEEPAETGSGMKEQPEEEPAPEEEQPPPPAPSEAPPSQAPAPVPDEGGEDESEGDKASETATPSPSPAPPSPAPSSPPASPPVVKQQLPATQEVPSGD